MRRDYASVQARRSSTENDQPYTLCARRGWRARSTTAAISMLSCYLGISGESARGLDIKPKQNYKQVLPPKVG